MGIRVNKMCGYALTDVAPDDPRVNWDSRAFKYGLEGREALESYLSHLETSDPLGGLLDRTIIAGAERSGKRPPDAQDAVVWGDGDGGLERVLCLRPISCEDWRRNDDILDWIEEAQRAGKKGPDNRVDELPFGIYPWSGLWMDSRTGQRLGAAAQRWAQVRNSVMDNPADDPPAGALGLLEDLAGGVGMTHAEATERVKPWVPDDVRLLAEWAGLFTGPLIWTQLRPVVYVWWA